MATSRGLSLGHLMRPIIHTNSRYGIGEVRWYSQYAPKFIKPVYSPKELDELLASDEAKEREFKPVRAAYNSHTSSVFHDPIVRKFTNYVMKAGQKALARDLVEKTFEEVKHIQLRQLREAESEEEQAKIECNPITIFHKAVENGRPILQFMPIKRGGINYQVPVPITEQRSYWMSMKWLVEAGREKERTMHFPQKLARELLDAARGQGRVVKKKQDLHRQCENNRAYAHYRWG